MNDEELKSILMTSGWLAQVVKLYEELKVVEKMMNHLVARNRKNEDLHCVLSIISNSETQAEMVVDVTTFSAYVRNEMDRVKDELRNLGVSFPGEIAS